VRTQFTAEQLADPDFKTSEQVLRRCVHCGFCTATCPTYMLLGDELDSPRGRIYLIKEMLESGKPPAPQTVKHVDRCLSCLSCVTTCPSGVDYMHLVDHARDYIEKNFERPVGERLHRRLLGFVLSRPHLFRISLRLAAFLRPFASLLPQRLRNSLALAPASLPPRGITENPTVFAAQGTRRGRVALLSGCAQPVVAPSINEAAIRLLTRHGIEVVIARGAGCCGALTHHLGQSKSSHALAEANIAAWMRELEESGLDAIVTTTSGCGTMLKDYGHVFREHPRLAAPAKRISSLARDITEYVSAIGIGTGRNDAPSMSSGNGPGGAFAPLRVAYQSPCSMNHGQKIHSLPMQLLGGVGYEVQALPEAHVCCGSAGTYNLLQPQIAARLRERKQALIEAQRPDVVATGNVGCMMQLSQGCDIPIVHTVELLDWATGGPKPRMEARR
jgi:glycolate oxidase iron-sulfur subunit